MIVAVVIIALIILLAIAIKNGSDLSHHTKDLLTGLWVGDPEFCNKSDIDGMMLYIGPDVGDSTHKAYLIMHSNNSVILQKTINMTVSGASPNLFVSRTITRSLELSDSDDDSDMSITSIMPLNQVLTIDTVLGKMTWTGLDESDKECVYAELYKDNLGSAM